MKQTPSEKLHQNACVLLHGFDGSSRDEEVADTSAELAQNLGLLPDLFPRAEGLVRARPLSGQAVDSESRELWQRL